MNAQLKIQIALMLIVICKCFELITLLNLMMSYVINTDMCYLKKKVLLESRYASTPCIVAC